MRTFHVVPWQSYGDVGGWFRPLLTTVRKAQPFMSSLSSDPVVLGTQVQIVMEVPLALHFIHIIPPPHNSPTPTTPRPQPSHTPHPQHTYLPQSPHLHDTQHACPIPLLRSITAHSDERTGRRRHQFRAHISFPDYSEAFCLEASSEIPPQAIGL